MSSDDAGPPDLLGFPADVATRLEESGLEVVVTGGSGWMGRATLEMLESSLGSGFSERVHVFGSTTRPMTLRSGTRVPVVAISALPDLRVGRHLVAHFAFATKEFVDELGTDEYVRRNQRLTQLVSDHVARSEAVGLFVPSSGAASAGGDLGANPYAELKRRDERRFLDLAGDPSTSLDGRLVMPRVFNLAGPFLNKPDRYALGSILTDIGRGGPVRLTATRPVVRSYVHVGDLVALAFALLTGAGPLPGGTFDTAGERDVEVGELALVATSVLGHPDMPIERPPLARQDPDRYVGDPAEMHRLMLVNGLSAATLPDQIRDTARYLGV